MTGFPIGSSDVSKRRGPGARTERIRTVSELLTVTKALAVVALEQCGVG